MQTENYYIKNLETGKIELHFNKSIYQALPEADKQEIKSNFLWSNFLTAWVSRSSQNTWRAEAIAKRLNLAFEGEQGEKLSFAEKLEKKQEKALNRALYMAGKARKFETLSTQSFSHARNLGSVIPFGQPILVGHHSEGRHRRHIEKIDSAMRKSVELDNKADYYANRANAAENTANLNFNNPVYLENRIKEATAEIKKLERYLQGKFYTYSPAQEISEAEKERYTKRIEEETEKLNFYTEKLKALGVTVENGSMKKEYENKKITHVFRRGQWYPVKIFNSKSVTILNWIGISHATWMTKYSEITKTATADDNIKVLDRDGNEVKPQVKFK